MKKILKILGIVAMVMVIGFGVAACDNFGGGGKEGTAKITIKNDTASGITVKIERRSTNYSVDVTSGFGEKSIAANAQDTWTFNIKDDGNNKNDQEVLITITPAPSSNYDGRSIYINIGTDRTGTWNGSKISW